MALDPEYTSFTLDNMGRYLANTLLDEALPSAGIAVPPAVPPPDARRFDVIVVGGGSFASAFAQHLLAFDTTNSRRILVLERGPFVLPEHVQNLPFMGGLPDWTRPWEFLASGANPGLRVCLGGRSLEWGGWSPELLATEFASWPPAVVDALTKPVTLNGTAMPPYYAQASEQIGTSATNDFIYGPLHAALREQLYAGLATATGGVAASLPLPSLPQHPAVRYAPTALNKASLYELLGPGAPPISSINADQIRDRLKLEAPLAVQARTAPGQFPSNKFSALPLLVSAARIAGTESYPYDQLKRLMVVPGWHVQELATETLATNDVRVTGVWVVRGPGAQPVERHFVPLADGGVVVIAAGTVESTRLARQTFQQSLAWRAYQRMGHNLMAHLRSNLTIRVPRTAISGLPAVPPALEVSALFVKAKATVGGAERFMHLQITASGLTATGRDSEAELFKKIPDLDHFDRLRRATDTTVVVTLRGIGEMSPQNPDSYVATGGRNDFGRPTALVALGDARAYAEALASGSPTPPVSAATQNDAALWDRMDELADEVALIFAGGSAFEILTDNDGAIPIAAGATKAALKAAMPYVRRRDGLGTTHHESGTLWMGDSVAASVTDGFGRVHDTTNCFVAGPAVIPRAGSPNPMLAGVALARRTADYLNHRHSAPNDAAALLPRPAPFPGSGPGWTVLFDGSVDSYQRWVHITARAGASGEPACDFRYVDGQLVSIGAGDFGLLVYGPEAFSNFVLRLQFRVFSADANSGIFVRIRDPRRPLPEPIASRAAPDLMRSRTQPGNPLTANLAWTAVHSGFEVQIDDRARGDPSKDFYGRPETQAPPLRKNRTGAVYRIPAGDPIPWTGGVDQELQRYQPGPLLVPRPWPDPAGWYEYEIRAVGDTYDVFLGLAGASKVHTSAQFQNTDGARGVPVSSDAMSGFIGLQAYSQSRVAFRRIELQKLP
jgi:choline dehydrogenase-like flavoprotein